MGDIPTGDLHPFYARVNTFSNHTYGCHQDLPLHTADKLKIARVQRFWGQVISFQRDLDPPSGSFNTLFRRPRLQL